MRIYSGSEAMMAYLTLGSGSGKGEEGMHLRISKVELIGLADQKGGNKSYS